MNTDNTEAIYSFNVNMYKEPPVGFGNIWNLQQMALQRLDLYLILDKLQQNQIDLEVGNYLKDSPFRFLLKQGSSRLIREVRRIDDNSHWILRLCYCRERKLHKIFIKYELEWFKIRFNNLPEDDQIEYLRENDINLPVISQEEKDNLNLTFYVDLEADVKYYKVKFADVPTLVKTRQHPLLNGYLYFPCTEIVHYLLDCLKLNLEEALIHSKKVLPQIHNDQLDSLLSITLVQPQIYYKCSRIISLDNIDEYFVKFPLCMRFMHETLREKHHLKYFSRMQYGLFLKGLGLSLSDSLTFWKEEFLNNMTEQEFMKRYSYLFKHHYGTVGNKTDHSAYSCKSIFEIPVSAGQIHGCPFKHWDNDILKNYLRKWDITQIGIEDIMQSKEQGSYREACSKCFERENCCKLKNYPITHPNQYFEEIENSLVDIEDIFVESD